MALKLNGTNSVAAPAYAGADADTGLQCGTDEVNLVTGGTARLHIDSSGNVGIGTSSPASGRKLHVSGTGTSVQIDSSNTSNLIKFTNSAASVGFIGYQSDNLVFYTNNSERLRIDSSGNVGIGTTSPSAALEVARTTDMAVIADTTGTNNSARFEARSGDGTTSGKYAYIRFNNNDTNNQRYDVGTYGTNDLTFRDVKAGSTRMTLDTSGRVLVGHSSSVGQGGTQSLLQVAGDGAGSSLSLRRDTNGTGSPLLLFGKSRSTSVGGNTVVQNGDSLGLISFCGADGTDVNTSAAFIRGEVDGTPGSNDMPGRLTFSTTADGASSPTERLRIDSSGNVGIGTSSPTSLLFIRGGAATATISSTTNTANLDLINSTQTTRLGASNTAFAITHNGAERMRIDSSGNVGINRSAPDNQLSIGSNASLHTDANSFYLGSNFTSTGSNFIGTGRHAQRLFFNNASGNGYLSYSNTSSAGTAGNAITWEERLRIDSSGRLLVGTSSNQGGYLFQVKGGDASLTKLVEAAGGNAVQMLRFRVHNVNNTAQSASLGGISAETVSGWGGVLTFHTKDANGSPNETVTERMRIDSSGRLLYGHSSSRTIYGIVPGVQIEGTQFEDSSLSITCNNASDTPILMLARSRGSSIGSNTALTDGQTIGEISFVPSDGTDMGAAGVRLQAVADDNHSTNVVPSRFVIQLVPASSESSVERFRLHAGGKLSVTGVYSGTTTGGSPVYVESDGDLLRYTSSLKYKTDVETIDDARADAILNCRPVWYRSKCDNDIKTEGSEKSDWGWYGFIAEEVAEIEPRLVNWATKDAVPQEDGSNKTVERDPADYEAEGVRYDNFVPLLLNLVKRQKTKIEALETQQADLLARVTALEAT